MKRLSPFVPSEAAPRGGEEMTFRSSPRRWLPSAGGIGARRAKEVFLLAFALLGPGTLGAVRANESVYQKVLPGTVWIITPDGRSGSGVLVDGDRKLVATSFHVVGLQGEVTVVFPAVNDEKVVVEKNYYRTNLIQLGFKGVVKARDPLRDLALIELEKLPLGAKAVEMAPAGTSPGQTVHSIGNPSASDGLWVYGTGSVRQVYPKRFTAGGQVIEARIVETQTPINPGDSGGPVVNDAGQLVALTCGSVLQSSLVSLCIDVDELKSLLHGEVKSIDPRVRDALESLGFKFDVTPFGVYRMNLALKEGESQALRVDSLTWPWGPVRVREIWTPLATPTGLSVDAAKRALRRNGSTLDGAWHTLTVDGKELLIFRCRIPEASDAAMLKATLVYVLEEALRMKKELAVPDGRQESLATNKSS